MIRSTVQRILGQHRVEAGCWSDSASGPLKQHDDRAIRRYLEGERQPFSDGYTEFKEQLVHQTMADEGLMEAFRSGGRLPDGFGSRLDERIVEYPWVFSRLQRGTGPIIDAGSTFNKASLLSCDALKDRTIVIYTLETDWITYDPRVSYLFGDLRDMILKDGLAQSLVCISTLEHVGFTYEYKTYSQRKPWPNAEPESYLDAVREFRRVLSPGGQFFLTVPFGRRENHGWLQQFDAAMIENVKAAFGGSTVAEVYYRYQNGGWQPASAAACSGLSYFNIHEAGAFEDDGLAAARAVCCLELRA